MERNLQELQQEIDRMLKELRSKDLQTQKEVAEDELVWVDSGVLAIDQLNSILRSFLRFYPTGEQNMVFLSRDVYYYLFFMTLFSAINFTLKFIKRIFFPIYKIISKRTLLRYLL